MNIFPRPNTHKYIFIIVGSSNLPSGKRDAYAYIVKFSRLGFHPYVCIDSDKEYLWIVKRLIDNGYQIAVNRLNDLDTLQRRLNDVSESKNNCDIVITISAHGFSSSARKSSGGCCNFFNFNNIKVDEKTLRNFYKPFEKNPRKDYILTFIDTCHSGNMVGFNRFVPISDSNEGKEIELKSNSSAVGITSNIISIAGCSQNQSLSQDISQEFGYSGSLTCAIMDMIKDEPFSVNELASYAYGRIINLGSHVTVNQISLSPSMSDLKSPSSVLSPSPMPLLSPSPSPSS